MFYGNVRYLLFESLKGPVVSPLMIQRFSDEVNADNAGTDELSDSIADIWNDTDSTRALQHAESELECERAA